MFKILNFIKKSYIIFIILLFYIPITFATIFSFNKQGIKGDISINSWNGFSLDSWNALLEEDKTNSFFNSLIMGVIVSLIVVVLSLITVFGLWRQKNKIPKNVINATNNVPLINPDVITAISISLVLSLMFGSLIIDYDGMWRAIASHVVMILPYGIVLMYPRSEKFKKSLFEASQDLGFTTIKTWFKTYFIFMIPIIIIVFGVSLTLSFDDFILTRISSNTTTIGTKLYEGSFKGWAFALGGFLLIITLISVLIISIWKGRKNA